MWGARSFFAVCFPQGSPTCRTLNDVVFCSVDVLYEVYLRYLIIIPFLFVVHSTSCVILVKTMPPILAVKGAAPCVGFGARSPNIKKSTYFHFKEQVDSL